MPAHRPLGSRAHYRWPGWLTRIGAARLIHSMSRKACSSDNTASEGLFGRLKTELFYPRQWQATTIEQFILEFDSCIRWTTKSVSRPLVALSARSSIERASEFHHNPVQDTSRTFVFSTRYQPLEKTCDLRE